MPQVYIKKLLSDAIGKVFEKFFFMGEWAPPFFGASSATPPGGLAVCVARWHAESTTTGLCKGFELLTNGSLSY